MGRNSFRNYLLFFYLMLLFSNRYFGIGIINLLVYCIGFLCLIFYLFRALENHIRFSFRLLLLLLILPVNTLLVITYNHNLVLMSIFIALSYLGAALLMNNTVIIPKFSYLPFIFNCLYLIMYYARSKSFTNVFSEQSVNYVSVVMILSLFPIFISQYQNNLKKSNYLVICISIFFSILALGRGGILACLVLLFFTMYFRVFNEKIKRNAILTILLMIITLVFIVTCVIVLPHLLGRLEGFREKGMDSNGRLLVWGIWLTKSFATTKGILFGENVVANIPEVFPHLHNSYLMFYAEYGLIGLLFCVSCLIKLGSFLYKLNKPLFSLFFVFCFRSFTDVVFGNFYGDFFLFYLIIVYFYKSKKLFSNYDRFIICKRGKQIAQKY